jgi:Zn-dependent M28 family amino/carboxypeptidase
VNLNFDMVGSPNYARFVYDGDGSATPEAGDGGPAGSDTIEQVFLDYFAKRGLATEPTAFDGRSDYGPFIAVGIAAGGLFTGAEGIKTPAQAAKFGGTAGVAFDPCYHQACDTIRNLSRQALDEMGDAAAHAVVHFTQRVPAVQRGVAVARAGKRPVPLYKGRYLQR